MPPKGVLHVTSPLTDSEVGQLCEVMPGAWHFHEIIQNVHGIKFQAFGFVHGPQNVLWNKNGTELDGGLTGTETRGKRKLTL